jgi:hypothetical protein
MKIPVIKVFYIFFCLLELLQNIETLHSFHAITFIMRGSKSLDLLITVEFYDTVSLTLNICEILSSVIEVAC